MDEQIHMDDEAWQAWLVSLKFSERWAMFDSLEGKTGFAHAAFVAGRRSSECLNRELSEKGHG